MLNQYLSRLKFEHRYRVEQRWFHFRDGRETYLNRLRYRLNLFVPFNQRTVTANTVFLSVYDEIFLNPKGPVFERNRVYAGLGYQFDRHWVAQGGWVLQTNFNVASFDQGVFTPQSAASKNNLMLAITYRLLSRQKPAGTERVPSQPD